MKNFNEAKPNIKIVNNALNLKIPDGFKQFNEMMIDLYEN